MVQIPEAYEQTPSCVIERYDGKYTYAFKSLDDPTRAIIVVDDKILDWTDYLNNQMKAGLIKKK